MRSDTRNNLVRLLELVETKLGRLPKYTHETRLEHRQAVETLQLDLEQEGAHFSEAGSSIVAALGGTRGTSTMGTYGALQNWCHAVRRRLDFGAGK